jgi:SlyX protein
MEQRIVDLEIRYTHQQATIEALNEVVFEQQKAIHRLTKELDELRKRIDADVDAVAMGPADNSPPPHY